MPPKTTKYAEGERVLCFHGPLLYEAKALRSQVTKDKQVKYFIHYAGWNKNWDEWVPESRVLKYSEHNVLRQKDLSKIHVNTTSKNKKGSVATNVAITATKPRKADSSSSSGKDADSRASTPSKELKDAAASMPATMSANSSAATTPVPSGAAASNITNDAGGSASSTNTPAGSGGSGATSNTGTSSSRLSRGSKNSAPAASSADAATAKDELKDEPKKKRNRIDTVNPQNSATPSITTTLSSSTSATSGASSTAGVSAADLAASAETEDQFNAKVEIKIKIPDDLKPWLVDDWDAINQQQKLLDLPAKTTVRDIVNAYVAQKKGSKQPLHTAAIGKDGVVHADISASLVEYFDVMLGCQLLYKFERPQYAELLEQHPDRPMSSLYGAFHLLRLFTRLGSMMAFTSLDEKAVQLLQAHLHDFLKYMTKNVSSLFSIQQFVNVTSEYHRKMQ